MASSAAPHMAFTPTSPPLESQPRHSHCPSLSQGRALYHDRDFASFINDHGRSNALLGYNGLGEQVPFIRHSDLVQYWEDKEIEPRLRTYAQIAHPAEFVNCEITFSILIYIGMPEFIHDFQRRGWTDSKLPLTDGPQFDRTPPMLEMLSKFRENQWQFCALMFKESRPARLEKIDPRQILPIKTYDVLKEPLNSDSRTKVCKVTFHDGCTDLSPDNIVVFKEYQVRDDETHRGSCEREVRTFSSIGSDDNIVKYLGSFEQADRCVVILEYANGGSLLDFFQCQNKPGDFGQTQSFWRALTQLSKGISSLHHIRPAIYNRDHLGCAHRDIKPSNILVFDNSPGLYTKNYRLKLADFNVATDVQPMSSNGTSPQNNDGDRTYRSPEASRVPDYEETQWREIGLDGDIWSFGCVCSEAVVWLGNGMMGLDKYTAQRRTEHASQLRFQKSGYETCFHDGENVLKCVSMAHQTAFNSLPRFDKLTPQICNIIETAMLVRGHPKGHRLIATQLCSRFDDLLNQIPEIKVDPPKERESNPGPKPPQVETVLVQTEQPPSPKMANGLGSKRSSRRDKRRQRHASTPSMDLANPKRRPVEKGTSPRESRRLKYPHECVQDVIDHQMKGNKREGLKGFERFSEAIGKRHFILFIDESVTMGEHLEDVVNTIKAFVWLLEPCERKKIEVRFSSDPDQPSFHAGSLQQCLMKWLNKTKHVVDLTEQRLQQRRKEKKQHVCNMVNCLDTVLGKVVRQNYPTSLFVLTDGIWEHRTRSLGGNAERSIRTCMDMMKNQDMGPRDFCIQFVRFGDDRVGESRLTYLDDMAKDNKGGVDIVDHKDNRGSIWPILIGAVSDANDNDSGDDDGHDHGRHDEVDDGTDEEHGAGTFQRGGANCDS
ncbi:hypothetical protein B0T10DRAFT_457151 [Thelonectria olida]|uniref:Protein kinase domain-containing protein n=1 Tax=Thelonectria olida TaxID=1576542 RepID=A0A9P8W8A8_9HYPO|nr:hypothetical protein B0T10DRAFT_457151 [Thelonectria olida]